MDSPIIAPVIAGLFSLITGLASVWLKDYLEQKRNRGGDKKLIKKDGFRSSRAFLVLISGLFLGIITRALRGSGQAGPPLCL